MRAPVNRSTCDALLAPIRGLHSLRAVHVETITGVLATARLQCAVESHDDYDGNMMIMITPPAMSGEAHSYILQASRAGIELAIASEDILEMLACFETFSDATEHLTTVIATVSRTARKAA